MYYKVLTREWTFSAGDSFRTMALMIIDGSLKIGIEGQNEYVFSHLTSNAEVIARYKAFENDILIHSPVESQGFNDVSLNHSLLKVILNTKGEREGHRYRELLFAIEQIEKMLSKA